MNQQKSTKLVQICSVLSNTMDDEVMMRVPVSSLTILSQFAQVKPVTLQYDKRLVP